MGGPEFRSLQDEAELSVFIDLLRINDVRSYLEIGSKFGGSLWSVANALPKGSRIVSVDLNVNGSNLLRCIGALKVGGYDAHLIVGNSMDVRTIAAAEALAPFDCVFIDGDHKPAAVMADWENYGPMARIVALHDIGWTKPTKNGKTVEVPKVWNKIKAGYRHEEICRTGDENGIGVLWR